MYKGTVTMFNKSNYFNGSNRINELTTLTVTAVYKTNYTAI
jgi:hypothetical protein